MQKNDKGEPLLKFENPELDKRIGGLPLPSLTLVEGPNDSGKSVLVQQITYAALKAGLRVLYITTENTVKGLLSNMESLNWNVMDFFAYGVFKITPLHVSETRWTTEVSKYFLITLLNYVKRRCDLLDLVVVDSLTHLIVHANENDVLDFFSQCRQLVDFNSKTFILVLHPYSLNQELLVRIRAICDGHFNLSIRTFREKNFLTLNVAKLKGASQSSGSFISFEVSPAFGIKVLPFTAAKG